MIGLLLVGLVFIVLFVVGYIDPRAAEHEAEEVRQQTHHLN